MDLPGGAGNPFGDPDMTGGALALPAPGGLEDSRRTTSRRYESGRHDDGGYAQARVYCRLHPSTPKNGLNKAAPPLAMGLGLAMMQGISITEKDDFLLIASKDHVKSHSGSAKNPVKGSRKELFKE